MPNPFIRDHIRSINPYEPIIPLDVLSEKLGIPFTHVAPRAVVGSVVAMI